MKIFLSLLLLLSSLSAFATGEGMRNGPRTALVVTPVAPWRFSAYLFSPEFRYERSSDLDLGYVSYIGYGIGARRQNFAVLLESASTTASSGNQALSISREHRDWILSGRYFFWNKGFSVGTIGCFVAGGVGFYNETVRTTLNGVVTQDNGNRESLASAGLGTEANFSLNGLCTNVHDCVLSDVALTAGAEIRILASKNFDPNPEPVGLARFGISF